jgi:hypothetical protein
MVRQARSLTGEPDSPQETKKQSHRLEHLSVLSAPSAKYMNQELPRRVERAVSCLPYLFEAASCAKGKGNADPTSPFRYTLSLSLYLSPCPPDRRHIRKGYQLCNSNAQMQKKSGRKLENRAKRNLLVQRPTAATPRSLPAEGEKLTEKTQSV